MFNQLKHVCQRFGHWLTSKHGRIIWTRILLIIIMIPISAYLTVIWRIMLDGSATDQTAIIYMLIMIITIRNGWKQWNQSSHKLEHDVSEVSSEKKRSHS